MPANSVQLVAELPRKTSSGSGKASPFRHRFDFSRMYVDTTDPVSRRDEAFGYEPMERFVFFEPEEGSLRPTLEATDLVFIIDGMTPRCEVSYVAYERAQERSFLVGRDQPVEQTTAWAIYCQQTGRMG